MQNNTVLRHLEINSPHSKKSRQWEWAEITFTPKLISTTPYFIKFKGLTCKGQLGAESCLRDAVFLNCQCAYESPVDFVKMKVLA